jgi:hypothetical protein
VKLRQPTPNAAASKPTINRTRRMP